MLNFSKSAVRNRPPSGAEAPGRRPRWRRLDDIRIHIAEAMIGRTVQLFSVGRISRGIVAAVFIEQQMPKLVVNGTKYNLDHVLTVTPTSLN